MKVNFHLQKIRLKMMEANKSKDLSRLHAWVEIASFSDSFRHNITSVKYSKLYLGMNKYISITHLLYDDEKLLELKIIESSKKTYLLKSVSDNQIYDLVCGGNIRML